MNLSVFIKSAITTLTLAGSLVLSGCSSVPFSVETPSVVLDSLSLLDSTERSQRFQLDLRLSNPNDFDVAVQSMRLNLRVASEGFIDGETNEPVTIPARGDATVRVTLSSEFVSSVSRLMAYLQGPESTLPYDIEGEIALDARPPRFLRFSGTGRTPLLIVADGRAVGSP